MKLLKASLISLIVLLSLTNSHAQDYKGYLDISLGAAIPTGDFGSNEIGNQKSGFAETGIKVSLLNFGYDIKDGFGIAGSWFGAAHLIDQSIVDDGIWAYGSLMAGPAYFIYLDDNNILDINIKFGIVNASYDISGNEGNSNGFGYDIGFTYQYLFAKRWGLVCHLDYFKTNMEFEFNSGSFEQDISSVSITAGIAFRF